MIGSVAGAAAYDAREARDPFVALVTPEGVLREPRAPDRKTQAPGPTGDVVLEGIVYDPHGGSVAVINGNVLKAGDVREGLEVLRIEPTRVVVLVDGRERELSMPVPAGQGEGGT